MGGKNSVFRKPLGTGKGSVNKAIDKTPILKDIKKVTNKINNEIGTGKVGSVYEANKAGINATAGLAARGAAAYFSLGATEALGVGHHVTNQFGGDKNISQYGGTVGTLSGIGGLATTAAGSAVVGYAKSAGSSIAAGAKTAGGKLLSSGAASQLLSGAAAPPQQQGGDVGFLDNIGTQIEDGANKWASNQIGSFFNPQGSNVTKNTAPIGQTSGTRYVPVKNDNKKLMYIGGGLLGLVLVIFAVRK